ncbi:1-phosphofructokinase family hexose kinase [Thermus sp.]|uniref:1-phosphofructokinase family hexose kinase n=1 Tax=Thermus sp. TaxID=275 RepID=UPI003D1285BC
MILALTPCPCLDRVLHLERPLRRGALHRVARVEALAGGKGLNLVRAVVRLGGEALAVAPLGGVWGEALLGLAREEGLPLRPLPGTGGRACHVLADPKGVTEVYEPCPPVPEGFLEAAARLAAEGGVRVLSGSLPKGLPPEALLEAFRPFAVDSLQAFPKALELGVDLVKPNRKELAALLPGPPLRAARALHRRYGVGVLASLGEAGALYAGPEGAFLARGPRREGNPVGSGDTFLGAFLLARERGEPLPKALAFAVAAAAANVGRGGGRVDREEVAALLKEVEVVEA